MSKFTKFYLALCCINAYFITGTLSFPLAIIFVFVGLLFLNLIFAVSFNEFLKNDPIVYTSDVKSFAWIYGISLLALPILGYIIQLSTYQIPNSDFPHILILCLFWFIIQIPLLISIISFVIRNKTFIPLKSFGLAIVLSFIILSVLNLILPLIPASSNTPRNLLQRQAH